MLKYKKTKRILSLVMSVFMVMGCFTTNILSQNMVYASQKGELFTQAKVDLAQVAMDKIESQIMDDFKNEKLVEIMVYMNSQVDTEMVAYETQKALSAATTPYQTKLLVRRNVVEALRDNAETSQAKVLNYLKSEKERGNVEDFESYTIVNMLYVKATKEVIENLSYMAEVGKIYKNKTHTLDVTKTDVDAQPSAEGVEWNVSQIRADEVWGLGYDGTGIVVGNIDSGVDWTHPALKNKWRGFDTATGETTANGNWFDPVYNSGLPADSDNHGTHVMGTMVGQELNGSNKVGVAPGAKWIAARVFNTAGSTTDAILLSAAQWMLSPGGNSDNAPDVINNSWGGGAGINDWYRDAVRAWRAAGIVPIFSAGNQRAGEPAPWPGSISCPANYPESIAVAALDRNKQLASFSKLGPSPYDETMIKPNLSAGGVNIRSSIPGGGYALNSGTSMSAPAVSGAVALILSANSSLSVDEIQELLKNTATPLTDNKYPTAPNMGYGYGIIDAFEAVSSVASGIGLVSGRVLVPGEDIAEATIDHEQQIFETYMGSNIEIIARITDDVSVTEAELLVKQQGKSYWMVTPMTRMSGNYKDGNYKGLISSDMIDGEQITYKIKVRDYAGDVVVSQDYNISVEFGIIPGEYAQGFEEDLNGWILDGIWEAGIPANVGPAAYEGKKVVSTVIDGNYTANADSWLISPPIDLRDVSLETASLRFYEWSNISSNDFGNLLISDDFGESWTAVRPAITGVKIEWKEAMVNLNDYIGSLNPIFVAFNFTSNTSGQSAGWYIDDVRLLADDNDAPESPSNLTARAGLSGIKLNWNYSSDADVSHYNIYRSEAAGEGYVKIADTINNGYMDEDLVVGTTYYYVVASEDFAQNESIYSEEVSAKAVEGITIFTTDFEENDGGFITGATKGTSPWEWGIPTSGPMGAVSGEKLWATNLAGTYPNSTDAYLETPAIVIPEDKDGILLFNHWLDFEGTTTLWDYGQVMISKDDGETWVNITPVTGGKYGKRVQEWTHEEIFLDGYHGQTVKIRFYLYSDSSTAYDGWYIDDVSVVAIDYIAPEPIYREEITYDDGTVEEAINLSDRGDGFAVKFTPAQFGKVEAANIYIWDNSWPIPGGSRLGFVIYDSNQNQVGSPIYIDNLVRGGWNLIDLSEFNFTTGNDFYISTIQDVAGTTINPGVGLDHNPDSDWSRTYLNLGGMLIPYSGLGVKYQKSIMIRAIVDYTVEESAYKAVNIEQVVKATSKNVDATILNFSDTMSIENELESSKIVLTITEYKLKAAMDKSYQTVEDKEVQNIPMVFAGIPIAGAVVTIRETGRSIKVDPITGKFSMKVPMGTYTLVAEAYGYYLMEKTVEVVEDQNIKINFMLEHKPQGTIAGQIHDRFYGTAAAYAVIRIAEDQKIAPVIADENGNFVINGVYEGEYTLKVVASGFESGEKAVTVVGNKTTNVNIGLKRFVGYENEIVYDDGIGENALVLNDAGNGLAVRFTPLQYGKVKGANIYFWDTSFPTPGGNRMGFIIYGIGENGQAYQVGAPIFQNVERGAWNFIDLSSFEFATDGDFYISTMQDVTRNYSPAVGADMDSSYTDRSYLNIAGEFMLMSSQNIKGGLMIRAIMEYGMDIPVITNLSELSYTNKDKITVEGILSLDGIVHIYVNGEKATSVESIDKMFTAQIALTAEENIITVTAELNGIETEPSAPVVVRKYITNVSPAENLTLRQGEVLTVSFNAPADGQGYFRLMLPFDMQNNAVGIPMADDNGLYTGSWIVPEGVLATGLIVEVVYINESGVRMSKMADGRVTIIGKLVDLAPNSVIIGDVSYDIEYLNSNASAQAKLIEWYNTGGTAYIKINGTDIVTENGQEVSIEVLPDFLTHFDANGEVTYYEK